VHGFFQIGAGQVERPRTLPCAVHRHNCPLRELVL
jgi:hypothetical protein